MNSTAIALLAELPDIAERTAEQLKQLHAEPSAVRAELMALQAEGLARHARRLHEELRRERYAA